MSLPIRALGMVWYRAEDYDAILRIMTDRHILPSHYHVWLMNAETGEKKYRRDGYIVIRAYIDPETFPDWCRTRGLNVDAEARMQYANITAHDHVRNTH